MTPDLINPTANHNKRLLDATEVEKLNGIVQERNINNGHEGLQEKSQVVIMKFKTFPYSSVYQRLAVCEWCKIVREIVRYNESLSDFLFFELFHDNFTKITLYLLEER